MKPLISKILSKNWTRNPVAVGLTICLIPLITSAGSILWFSSQMRQNNATDLSRDLEVIARTAGTVLDLDLHKKLLPPNKPSPEDYQKAVNPLVAIHKAVPEITYLYTMMIRDGKQYLVLDTKDADQLHSDHANDLPANYLQYYADDPEGETQKLIATLKTGHSSSSLLPFEERGQLFVSGFSPLPSPDPNTLLSIEICHLK